MPSLATLLRAGAFAMLAFLLQTPAAPSAGAQTSQLRYRGSLWIGNRYAPAGVVIHVVAFNGSRRAQCGNAVTDARGGYDLAIIASAECIARTAAERPTLHIFVVNGENAGHFTNGASLDEPRSMRPMAKDPRVADIPGFDRRRSHGGADLVGVRYYGRATPSAGTIRVEVGDHHSSTVCGVATIAADGTYVLDVAAASPCIARTRAEAPLHHQLFAGAGRDRIGPPRSFNGGEHVATVASGASLDQPRSLGSARNQDARLSPAR